MRKGKMILGILGGMGSQASNWLLNRITALSKAETDQDYLEILLHNNSKVPDRTTAILHHGQSPVPELERSLKIFENCGVEVVVMACMTAHYYYDQIKSAFSGEIIHPVDLVIDELSTNLTLCNKRKVGVIGSSGMLQSGVFHKKLQPLGYDIITLDPDDQQMFFMDPIYKQDGFKSGVFKEENISLFLNQLSILQSKGAEVIVGACSEIPLVINPQHVELPFIDSFELLAQKAAGYCHNNHYHYVT